MISFLFWNINKKDLGDHIRDISLENEVDVLVLAENEILPAELLIKLNEGNPTKYTFIPSGINTKIDMFTRFSSENITIQIEDNRTTIRTLSLPGIPDFLLAITHFFSKNYWSNESQAFECVGLSNLIISAEKAVGHKRTILFGDLNMNPFESGMVASNGLHAVSSKEIAKKGARKVNDEGYTFFYNPMWNLFGDSRKGPPGSYYYARSTSIEYFWYIFDQVLVRPDMIKYFNDNELRIITSYAQGMELIKSDGTPNSAQFSDHLPLFFTLNI